jgi:selenocysteine lyase/cysteine desulfurase
MPQTVYKAFLSYLHAFNAFAPYEVLLEFSENFDAIKSQLASLISCAPYNLSFTRNTTESINSIIWSLPLKAGDEIIIANCDYPNSVNAIKSRAQRDGLIIKELDLNLQDSDEAISRQYKKAIEKNTKLILATYITHREGQIMPIKSICNHAHSKGVEVLVDAAHALGHIDHSVIDLGCDYYATSLHKWLNAPLGSGLLYIKNGKAAKLIPCNVSPPMEALEGMEKYNYVGTHDYPRVLAIGAAIDFLKLTGIEAKQARLHALKMHWINALKDIDGIEIVTDPARSCAVAAFRFTNPKVNDPHSAYRNNHNIHLKKSGYRGVTGFLRVSTNLFLNEEDIDKFIHATRMIAHV